MQLLYLYIDDFRTHKAREFNFDSNYRFSILNRQLHLTRKRVVPGKFFRVDGAATSHVDAVSAIVGENGTGKTSVAAFLNEALANGIEKTRKFVCVLKVRQTELPELKGKDAGRSAFLCLDNLNPDLDTKELAESRPGRWVTRHLRSDGARGEIPVRAIYYSPYFSSQNSADFEKGAFEDVSTSRFVIDHFQGDGIERFAQDDRERTMAFLQKFAGRAAENVSHPPFTFSGEVTISGYYERIGELSRIFRRNERTHERDSRSHYYEDSLDFVRVHDPFLCFLGGLVVRYYEEHRFDAVMLDQTEMGPVIAKLGHDVVKMLLSVLGITRKKWGLSQREADGIRGRMNSKQLAEIHRYAIHALETANLVFADAVKGRSAMLGVMKALMALEEKIERERIGANGVLRCSILSVAEQELVMALFSAMDSVRFLGLKDVLQQTLSVECVGMSSGEMAFATMMARIDSVIGADAVRGENPANVLLFLDEAETTLHPDFQRRLVETLIWYVEHFTSGLRVHLVFASHSPMLLSDIPKGNVVFLPTKRSPEAAEEQRQDFEQLGNTFGANVYDLMRLSFGMNSGVFGSFAEKKLDALLEKNRRIDRSERRRIADLFGDELIRRHLAGRI